MAQQLTCNEDYRQLEDSVYSVPVTLFISCPSSGIVVVKVTCMVNTFTMCVCDPPHATPMDIQWMELLKHCQQISILAEVTVWRISWQQIYCKNFIISIKVLSHSQHTICEQILFRQQLVSTVANLLNGSISWPISTYRQHAAYSTHFIRNTVTKKYHSWRTIIYHLYVTKFLKLALKNSF